MDTREAARRFAEVWERGWAAHDVAAITELYTEDCVHRSLPFRPPHAGRDALMEYVRWSFADERTDRVEFGVPIVDGDRAVMEYWVTSADLQGAPRTLGGCVFVRFDDRGLAIETRDYWQSVPGRHPLQPFL